MLSTPWRGGGVLLAATVVALLWANSPWAASYDDLLNTKLTIDLGGLSLSKSLHHWINDGLMSVFFFVVGLEIKRELIAGEFSDLRKVVLPATAAVGGMIVPAALYISLHPDPPLRAGWGVPMATDIAFALAVLAVLGSRVPNSLKVLLTALAIVDDVGAVLVIAVFYTAEIGVPALLVGIGGFVVCLALSRIGVRNSLVYFLVGTAVWLAFLNSGVHATIAALLIAFTIPARSRITGERLRLKLERVLARLDQIGVPSDTGLNTKAQQKTLDELALMRDAASAPLQTLEHALAPLVTLVVLPLFAFANAGIAMEGVGFVSLRAGPGVGILVGLVVGKPLGIFLFSRLAVRLGLAELPREVTWRHVLGVGFLGGVGFTMALFIGGLAFSSESDLLGVKVATLLGSAVAAAVGLFVLRTSTWQASPESNAGEQYGEGSRTDLAQLS